MNGMRHRVCSAACVLMAWAGVAAYGQTQFPVRTIRIVSSEAGGSNDTASRLVAEELQASLGQPVIVDNRGGGIVAGSVVAKSPPDGHTLLHYGNTFWLLPLMRDQVPYDPIKDFLPVTGSTLTVNVLAVHPSLPVRSVKELIALAKARPGQLDYASAAAGTSNHIAAELFKSVAGVRIQRIPFKGATSATNALASGEVQLMFPTYASAVPYLEAGRIRVLAVTTAKPTDLAPGLRPISDVLPGYESSGRFGFFVPAGTPAPIIGRLNKEIAMALNKPRTRERMRRLGADIEPTTPEEFAAAIRTELDVLGKLIKAIGLRDQ